MNISPLFPNHTTFALNSEKSLFKDVNFSELELLLKLGANVNETEKEFNLNFLQKCIIDGLYEKPELTKMVQLLIDRGIDVNHQDVDGCTALHFAICEEQYDLAKLLLDNGANPAIVDKRWETAYEDLSKLVNADPEKTEQRQEMLELLKTTSRPLDCKETVKYIIDHQLTYANLSAFRAFDDTDLKNLSENCPLIKKLILRSIKFTEARLGDALEKFINLECLDISWCIQITGKELKECPTLKKLMISGCGQVTCDELEQVIGKFPKLESINIQKCIKIKEDDFEKITQKYSELQITR